MLPLITLLITLITGFQSCFLANQISADCACFYQPINSTNINQYLSTHPFYSNISSYQLSSPIVSSVPFPDGACHSYLSCEPGLSLVLFDTDKSVLYPNSTASGNCIRETLQWNVFGAGVPISTYDTIMATCVEYPQSTTTTTAKPTSYCPCPFSSVNDSNAEVVSHFSDFWSNYQLSGTPFFLQNLETCYNVALCGSRRTAVLFTEDNAFMGNGSLNAYCQPTDNGSYLWNVHNLRYNTTAWTTTDFIVGCVEKRADRPSCNCSEFQLFSGGGLKFSSDDYWLSNSEEPTVIRDSCDYRLICDNGAFPELYLYSSAGSKAQFIYSAASSQWVTFTCLPETNQYLINGNPYDVYGLTCGSKDQLVQGGFEK